MKALSMSAHTPGYSIRNPDNSQLNELWLYRLKDYKKSTWIGASGLLTDNTCAQLAV